MKFIASELQYLSELYQRFKAEILASARLFEARNSNALTESVLKNRDLLARVSQMTARAAQLALEWEKFRLILDPQSKVEIQALAANVKSQAAQLEQLCKGLARRLEDQRRRIEKDLRELHNGSRYLNCVKPPSTNYPKFIDSHG
jgi:uncharacterized protein (DUF58 family)